MKISPLLYRTISGLNEPGRSLCQVRIADPTGSLQLSCRLWTFFNHTGVVRHHVAEYSTLGA